LNLKTKLEKEHITLPEDFFYKVQKYKEHLFKWNKIHNLTGARDEATIDAFIFDAIVPLSFIPEVKTLMDIGTGAGFPGMILAFGLPNTHVTLVEPLAKRASFLQFIKADLKLSNVNVVKKRVEEMEPTLFEMITSRAVTETKMLLQLSENFYDARTKFLFYKGEKVFDEIADVPEKMEYKVIERDKRHYLLLGEML
jgi:16S rRNA (guanine527-N7)-methyltransferase